MEFVHVNLANFLVRLVYCSIYRFPKPNFNLTWLMCVPHFSNAKRKQEESLKRKVKEDFLSDEKMSARTNSILDDDLTEPIDDGFRDKSLPVRERKETDVDDPFTNIYREKEAKR